MDGFSRGFFLRVFIRPFPNRVENLLEISVRPPLAIQAGFRQPEIMDWFEHERRRQRSAPSLPPTSAYDTIPVCLIIGLDLFFDRVQKHRVAVYEKL
jgi:hypothetical protein